MSVQEPQSKEFKKFSGRMFLFLSPYIIFFGLSTAMLWTFGELTSVEKVINEQKKRTAPILWGVAYNNLTAYLKLRFILNWTPDVLVLGSSRVMQFREEFFNRKASFYNGGGLIEKLPHFNVILQKIPRGAQPRVIIVGLDQNFFNSQWDRVQKDDLSMFLSKPTRFKVWRNGVVEIYRDYFKKKFLFRDIFTGKRGLKRFGMNAMINRNGFMYDGAYFYGKIMKDPQSDPDYLFKDTFSRIAEGSRRFEYGQEVSNSALNDLDAFLAECRGRGIYVVGFLPPYAHQVWARMKAMGHQYDYILKLPAVVEPVFKKYNFSFFDFTDLAVVGASDKEVFDGFHASEKAYVRLFISMVRREPVLQGYSDVEYLQKKVESCTNNDYCVFCLNR